MNSSPETGVRAAFADQARSCRALGSALTAEIVETLGLALRTGQGDVARRVLDWPGDVSSRGASVPLRLAGALHALVLQGKAPALAAAYAQGAVSAATLLATVADHQGQILDWLDHPPQTNEVGRSAALIGGARFALAQLERTLPLSLYELGASAGLNLNFPDYAIDAEDNSRAVTLSPDWRGDLPPRLPLIAPVRLGVDLNPVSLADPLRLRAYIWPDQPARLARLDAAIAHAQIRPPKVERADAAEWLDRQSLATHGHLSFVYHTVAHQYFPSGVQTRIARRMAAAGAVATPEAPLARFGMEADATPGSAALTLDLWDGNHRRWHLGRADFHGRWIEWLPVQG